MSDDAASGDSARGPDGDDAVVDIDSSSDGASGVLFMKTATGRVATVVKSSATNGGV